MTKTPQPRLPTKDSLAQLSHFSSLLHLLHHRNQNQHRRSLWYRHFSLFRRHLLALLADYTTLSSAPTSAVERTRLKTLTPGLHTRISKRLTFWQDVLVARWMRAFSQVVADGRFSVLGLVMLGVLGGVCRDVGVVDGLEVEGQAEIERVLEEFGREAWGDEEGGFGRRVARGEGDGGEAVARAEAGEPVARFDEGEVAAREDVDDGVPAENDEACDLSGDQGKPVPRKLQADQSENDEADEARAISSPPSSPPKVAKPKTASTKKRLTETKPKTLKKKRKKGGDAIDDLFSGW